jgi:hypothetical protein
VPLIQYFIGRNEYINALGEILLPDRAIHRRKTFVLHGLGGIGKTQLAIEFARSHQEEFAAVFFIDGSSRDAVLQSFAAVFRLVAVDDAAEAMTAPYADPGDCAGRATSEQNALKALEWLSLEGNTNWLLIFDNVDVEPHDPGGYHIEQFFPPKDWGSILVTTRLASLPVSGFFCQVRELDPEQSIKLLETHTTEDISAIEDLHSSKVFAALLSYLATDGSSQLLVRRNW